MPSDQHPPHPVVMGEDLIAQVYNAVRASPQWGKTLLIITYDEHGGCYDHVSPPLAAPPDNRVSQPFNFDRYGVRVPAVLISPYIKSGTILRVADDLPHQGPPYPFDHTSVIATLRQCFNLGGALTHRDAVAPSLAPVLNLDQPTNGGPDSVTSLSIAIPPRLLQAALDAPLNGFQKALHEAATHLPALGVVGEFEGLLGRIESHIGNLIHGVLTEVPDHRTPRDAMPFIKQRLGTCLGKG